MTNIRKENLSIERLESLRNEIEVLESKIDALYKEKDNTLKAGTLESLNWYKENVRPLSDRQDYCKELVKRIERYNVNVGDGVTICLYSDKHAGTIIKRTAKTITVQRDKAILDPNFKPEWIEGGFAGHCVNQGEQRYTYERDENGAITTYRWSDKYGRYCGGGDQSITIINGRHEYYDYNF